MLHVIITYKYFDLYTTQKLDNFCLWAHYEQT